MGVLDLTDKGEPAEPAAAPAEPETQAAPDPVALPPEPQEPVAVAIPPRPESRSARAARETREKIDALEKRDQERERQFREVMSRPQQPQYIPQPVYQAPPQQQQAGPDPEELFRQADKALDAREYSEHKRLERQAYTIIAQREARALVGQQGQQQQYTPPDPLMTATLAQYPEVTKHGHVGIQLAIAEDARLAAMGHPPGYGRLHAALGAASETIKGASKQNGNQPTYDRGSAAALSSSPTGRGTNGNGASRGAPALMLDPDTERTMRAVAKKAGMEWSEYITDYAAHHPELLRR